ncbi:trypsin-like serine peptidase [Plantibacter sp. YIM 135249]|uniref:trypsin-like serine peptidase n=1 Tax=Plantibacter sp. YIM 135249 TaxID=3423918 RepID=UPI003D32A32F
MKLTRTRGIVYLTALCVVAPLFAGCSIPVTGEAVAGGKAPIVDVNSSKDDSLRKDFDATPQEVNDYWTDDKFGGAKAPTLKPGEDTLTGDQATGVVVHPTTGVVPAVDVNAITPTAAGDPFTATGLVAATQGRLYFSNAGQTYVCSGSVVNSPSLDLVLTAGHCVWDTFGKKLAENIVFIPSDSANGQNQPYGQWVGASTYVPEEFTSTANSDASGATSGNGWAYDFALIRLAPNDGKKIQEVTGGQGIAFGATVEGLTIIGYPSAAPFDGTTERYCASRDYTKGYAGYRVDCLMTPGSSGGGWLTRLDPATGAGYVTSVTSRGDGTWLEGPVLGQKAYALYNDAVAEGS